ncbi:MAG: D-sedoheptulose-7-phosphate isomerase [Rhodospirillales bacterium]|jgi:D-sedoheptulose 7-phosphate isomerase
MSLDAFFKSELDEHAEAFAATREVILEPFTKLVETCLNACRNGKKLVLFGNGGSAADAQHIATELIVRYEIDGAPIMAMALTTDTSVLTAIANDYSFEDLFSRQVEGLCREGDVAIGISTSGQSENVIRALNMAKKVGAHAVGLVGRDGGRMKGVADPLVIVPATDTGRIQEMHIMLGHMLCGALERELRSA